MKTRIFELIQTAQLPEQRIACGVKALWEFSVTVLQVVQTLTLFLGLFLSFFSFYLDSGPSITCSLPFHFLLIYQEPSWPQDIFHYSEIFHYYAVLEVNKSFYMVANRICMGLSKMKAKLEEFLPVPSWQTVKVVEKDGKHEMFPIW